ncbi:MAG: hypothetical protein HN729_12715 [Candidatus Marinimicrobia bacterium]|jgi:hypothetical protein|nr:hypothetical protein [Candidatus Neomarinimicrobiota bacterium]MBT3634661.1 hypothetical protein [Candidatus Neomarinimicrobiota bacterium]MBT3682709.1 hypothetical protein [Candidatus Neomarinimicrobiota bacterium]MBT3759636.1 hypothetical protein [Candidatus Neomarinimicrobiota bacterium]MBT3894492.1 hypothetical protein [Candidatus Neomarinimicrobiota bacterium]
MNKKLYLSLVFFLFTGYLMAQDISSQRMSGALGTVTIDGKVYNQISFRPEIPIGTKMAVGLDIYLYIDGDGGLYKDAWNFKDGKSTIRTLLDKVYYFRYGQPSDDFYLRAGALPNITLGQGILVDGYSNIMEYPTVRRVGVNLNFRKDVMSFEAIASDLKRTPGVLGLRASFDYIPRLAIGVSLVTDMDQNKGLMDRDSDGYPDVFDDYDDDDNLNFNNDIQLATLMDAYEVEYGTIDGFDDWIESSPMLEALLQNPYDPNEVDDDPVTGAALDLTFKLNDKVTLYSQFAQLMGDTDIEKPLGYTENSSLGYGFVPIGISSAWGPVTFRAEYRQSSRKFLFNYWNRSYDIERMTFDSVEGKYITRESQLYKYGELKGFYIQADASIMEFLHFTAGYQDMTGEMWDDASQDFVDDDNKMFRTSVRINTGKIPKVKMAEAFYQQSDVPNPFKFDPSGSTILGYDIGVEISEGVMLVYKARRTYQTLANGKLESSTSVQFETQMVF